MYICIYVYIYIHIQIFRYNYNQLVIGVISFHITVSWAITVMFGSEKFDLPNNKLEFNNQR